MKCGLLDLDGFIEFDTEICPCWASCRNLFMSLPCFKAYDIRGRIPDELDEELAYKIGRAFVDFLDAKTVVVGHDIRLSSPAITASLIDGLTDSGADVTFIGQCGTEEVYFATAELGVDGGICVTASHNPIDYNGMKLVREGSIPISEDSGLREIQSRVVAGSFNDAHRKGQCVEKDMRSIYVRHLLTYIDYKALKPLKIVVNAGNGGAGAVIDELAKYLPVEFIKMHHEPDGSFPNGIPNPLLTENQGVTAQKVIESGADLGVAWDGDFDRCFFFDENGRFIEGYYVVGLLAEAFVLKDKGAKIVHDPRLVWNTQAIVEQHGGEAIESKTGHAFIKERMRKEDAVYGGEMSAHHYFRAFSYCDNGNIPWLLIVEMMSKMALPLSKLVDARIDRFPCSGEINRKVQDPKALLAKVEEVYGTDAIAVSKVDGLSIAFEQWRFNIRSSSTEPVVRLNVESREDLSLVKLKTMELLKLIEQG